MNMELETLCRNIKFLRTKYGISQDELAHTIHLARSTYSTYETGVKIPDLQTIDALSALYNISFDCLVNHDLTDGLIHRIYFEQKDKELLALLNSYLSLSIASKNIIAEDMKMIMEWEGQFYQTYTKYKTIYETGRAVLQKQQRDKLDGDGNRGNRSNGTEE